MKGFITNNFSVILIGVAILAVINFIRITGIKKELKAAESSEEDK